MEGGSVAESKLVLLANKSDEVSGQGIVVTSFRKPADTMAD